MGILLRSLEIGSTFEGTLPARWMIFIPGLAANMVPHESNLRLTFWNVRLQVKAA